jgi:hypothetical protein
MITVAIEDSGAETRDYPRSGRRFGKYYEVQAIQDLHEVQ